MIAKILATFQMGVDDLLHSFRREQMRARDGIGTQGVEQQRAERAAKPRMSWNIEAFLLAIKDGIRQLSTHQLTQHMFLTCPTDFQTIRQGSGELDDPMIEERRPKL